MRAKEFINEDVPTAGTDTEREVAQAIYMEGRCGVLAIAINQANPERYKLGYIYEYNVPGTEDMYLDPDEFDTLDPEEQQQVKLETQSWALVHAYVVDQQTKEYIDARGRHSKVPDLNYELNLTRKNVFPATSRDIVNITADMNWNDATEEWDIVKGLAAWNQLGLDRDIPKALDYAVKYLNIDLSKGSQSTPKKPVWMNPGDPLPPSSSTGTWVILGPYKNVLYRFSASTEQRASAMKDQWCKENNIDPDSNRFCRLKYDGNVRLGQPIKKQGVAEGSEQISEYRDRLLQYVKSLLPNYPEYVLKDWLVPNKGNFSNLPDTELKNGIMEKLKGAGLTPNTKWQLVPDMKFTMAMFEPMTKQRLIGRAGGHSDMGLDVPRDKERHATQASLAQQQGGVRKEPVLLIKTDKGYELLEGWHRTIQHFARYPNGYTGPAYVAVAQGQQGVAEGWSQKYKKSINCSHPKGFSQRAHCAGKKKQNESTEMEIVCETCGMCETHQGHEHLDEACWKGYHKEGNKKMFGKTYPNCVKNTKEDIDEASRVARKAGQPANSKKHSDLYTDENPRGTITGLKFATVEDAKSSISKIKNSGRSHAHKIQAAVAMEQRARAAGKASAAAIYRAYINSVKKTDEQQETTMTENQDELARILELSTGVSATDRVELNEEFDLIESIIDDLADRNGVDAETIWEDLDSLTDDELYVFAVTTTIMEDWQKANKRDKTDGMSRKAVNAYRRENPGSKLKTAVTTKPGKLKKGSKASKRRKSYCSRSRGQMKMHSISCAKTPDKAICKARRRWNC